MSDLNLFDVLLDLNHYDDATRVAAYDSLLELGPEAVPVLVENFETIDGGARLHVVRALGEIGDERAVPLLLELMRDRAPDSYFMLPSLAARALGQIGGEAAMLGLLGHLEDDNHGVRRMAAKVLGRFRDDRAVDGLGAILQANDAKLRVIAFDSLRRIGTPHAYALLAANGRLH